MRNLFLVIAVALAGCSTAVHPVNNPIPATPNGVYDISKVEVIPRARFRVPPTYPIELRRAHISGEAVILFTVKKDGNVADAMVTTATDKEFGAKALEAVLKWRFAPATVGGQPVDCRLMVPLKFTADN